MTIDLQSTLRGVLVLACLLGCVAWSGPPAAAQEEAPDPFEALREAYGELETPAEKLALLKTFMLEYPQHERVGAVMDGATGILVGDMDDRDGAVALVLGHMPQVDDAELKGELQDILMGLYSHPLYAAKLTTLVGERYDVADMSFGDHLAVIEAGVAAEAWGLVDEHCSAAKPLANAETFGADYPDRDFSDDYIEEAGRNRQGMLLTFTGWSAANQGDLKRAEKDFESAEKMVRKSFFGLPDNKLYRYRGQTLVKMGDKDRGLELLSLAGIYGMDHEALTIAEETFADMGRNPAVFDDYLWKIRTGHAPKMANFTANDYQDADHEFKDLIGEKATLLAFWFPT